MDNEVFYVHWRVSGENDTLMLARFGWWRFEVLWPQRDKVSGETLYPITFYHRNQYKGVQRCKNLSQCTGWIVETCKDLALAKQRVTA